MLHQTVTPQFAVTLGHVTSVDPKCECAVPYSIINLYQPALSQIGKIIRFNDHTRQCYISRQAPQSQVQPTKQLHIAEQTTQWKY